MFRKMLTLIVTYLIIVSCISVSAESWVCPICGNDATNNFCSMCGSRNTSENWVCITCNNEVTGNFCNNCGSPKPSSDITSAVVPTVGSDLVVNHTVVKDYVGRDLSLCGYTSMGGELREKYANSTLELVPICPDGTFIDISDKSVLESYVVVAQFPAAGTEFDITAEPGGGNVNCGFGEIVLIVGKHGDASAATPELVSITASPAKETQYLRDYRGRTLEDTGYTSMSGKRLDKYGPAGYLELVLIDEDGKKLDPSDKKNFKYYTVVNQSVMPNTKITFYYNASSVTGQTLDIVYLDVTLSDVGKNTIAALAAEEEQLRASGALTDLYSGTYRVGSDLPAGNYIFTHISDSCDLNIYQNSEDLNNDSGDWDFLYGDGDKSYQYLIDGMFVKVSNGAVKALRSDPIFTGEEFPLYSGIYHIGTDISAGTYEFSLISESCDLLVYDNETAYANRSGDWSFLYGTGDTEFYNLTDGMILVISDGATLATKIK